MFIICYANLLKGLSLFRRSHRVAVIVGTDYMSTNTTMPFSVIMFLLNELCRISSNYEAKTVIS